MRKGCGCIVWLVVEGGEGEDWGGVGEAGVGAGDVLAHRGSAVGGKRWGASGSRGGENESAVRAEIEREFSGEVWRGVG